MRYKIYEGSVSGHCCFEYTILDLEEYVMYSHSKRKWFENVCELFTKEHAELVCCQLNNGYFDYIDYYYEEGDEE